jgi:outer membrane protein OmpA-like peptidoglycan-associated protein
MRTPVGIVLFGLALATGCSSSSSSSQGSSVTVVPGPQPTSGVSVSSEDIRSSVEVRVGQILSELDTSQRPEGTVITLPERVLFDFDKADLKPEAAATLDKIVEVVNFYGRAPVAIRGHADSRGSESYNLDLSNRRAAAVRDYLVGKGVDQGRLEAVGLGKSQPVAPNTNPDGSDNPAGRQQNRRVEVVVEGVER